MNNPSFFPFRFRITILILPLVLSLAVTTLHGQFQPTMVKKSNNLATVNGKEFYLHEVLQGHTLYSIAKAYKVTEKEINESNPVLKTKPLSAGMVIRIPVIEISAPEALIHVVKSKETLSSLSRQYGIKVDDIRALNPDSKWGLTVGQQVKIPKDKITITQPPVDSPEIAKEVLPKTEVQATFASTMDLPCGVKPFPHQKDVFNLVILLPLNISANDSLVYSDMLKTDHFRFYEFLEGAYMAIDSLRKAGLNMNLTVLDTEQNTETLQKIISSGKLNQADLIIGPVYPSELEIGADFAKRRKIPLVNPMHSRDFTDGNPYVFQARLTPDRQLDETIEYLGLRYNDNIVIVGRSAESSMPEFTQLFEKISKSVIQSDPNHKTSPKLVFFNEANRSFVNTASARTALDPFLSRNQRNFIIIPSKNEVFTTELINQLNSKTSTYPLTAFGIYSEAFGSIDLENLFNVNFEVYSDLQENPFVDYQNPDVLNFCRLYKKNWNIEPSRYSFQGFDLTYYFVNALFFFGKNLTTSVPCWQDFIKHVPMQTPFRFKTSGNGNGFENQAIPIINYSKEELIRRRVN